MCDKGSSSWGGSGWGAAICVLLLIIVILIIIALVAASCRKGDKRKDGDVRVSFRDT